MLSRWLWGQLAALPYNPLYRRVVRLKPAGRTYYGGADYGRIKWVVAGVVVVAAGFAIINRRGLVPAATILLFLLLPFLSLRGHKVLIGLQHGLLWAVRISTTITQEQEQRTYDLLCVLPFGAFGACWSIGMGCLYRRSAFERARWEFHERMEEWTLVVFFLSVVLSIGTSATYPDDTAIHPTLLRMGLAGLYFALMLAFLYFDYVHSVLAGVLLGMAVPVYIHNRIDASLWTALVFVTAQVLVYAVTLLLALVVLPWLYARFPVTGWPVGYSAPLAVFGVYFGLREGMVWALWRLLTFRLNADMVMINSRDRERTPDAV